MHNGWIGGFRGPVGRRLLALLPDDLFAEVGVLNDSRIVFLLVAAHHRRGLSLAAALSAAVRQVTDVVGSAGGAATLNLAVGDGDRFVACRYSIGQPLNSLYWLASDDHALLASEPHDTRPGWKPVPPDHLIELTASNTIIVPLEELS